jgi:uncharacterized protein YbaA (DUF1428 family)
MTYVEGFIVAVPKANKEAYRSHAAGAWPLFEEFGITRLVEAWASDVPEGKVTDFRKAVQAKEDEDVVFSWFEYPDRASRNAVIEKMMSDPRMAEMGSSMPFDGKRMIIGGFEALLEKGSGRGAYVDGFVVPVSMGNKEAYRQSAEKSSVMFADNGGLRVVECWGDDIRDGTVTDFRKAVQAEAEENVVFSFIEWPDKATRDRGWQNMMENDAMKDEPMPFDGKRMFWGGFGVLLDTKAV